MQFLRNNLRPILLLLVLLIAIPVTVGLGRVAQRLLSEAAITPARISVDAAVDQGALPRLWEGIGQGGELDFDNYSIVKFAPVAPRLAVVGTKYIRLDHLLDRPLPERLPEIRAIAGMGATPVLALSYFPRSASATDVAYPYNWAAWEKAVSDLITQVSGPAGLNLSGVYYEVWNEPDGAGFGGWHVGGGGKDYLDLYQHTLAAASLAEGSVNPFKIGGPALADMGRPQWLATFLEEVDRRNLRLDFVSWHRYHRDVAVFRHDLETVEGMIAQHPRLFNTEKLVSEWGSDPGPGFQHDTNFDAAHFVAVIRALLGRVDLATKFEVRDGSYQAASATGLGAFTYHGYPKPLGIAMLMLSQLGTQRVSLTGEGTAVTGFATRRGDNVSIILSNFDKASYHTEQVPVAVANLTPGTYILRQTVLDGYNQAGRVKELTVVVADGSFSFNLPMLANSVTLLEFLLQRGHF